MSDLKYVPNEGESLGDLLDRMYYKNTEQAKRITELEAALHALYDAGYWSREGTTDAEDVALWDVAKAALQEKGDG